MRRRSFLVALSGAFARPAAAQAQSRPYRIGFLSQQPTRSSLFSRTFVEALRELGYVEGQNILIEWRFTPDGAKLPALAAELVGLNVEVIVSGGGPAVRAARQATGTIPIISAA